MESLFAILRHNTSSLPVSLSTVLGWLAGVSLLTFFLSLILLPFLIKRIPPDYFVRHMQAGNNRFRPTPFHLVLLVLRNIFGGILFIAGLAMLFLPGQGIITIFLSLLLLTFPGKKKIDQAFHQTGKNS